MEQTKSKKKGIIIGVVTSLLLIVTLGITYAYWIYYNTLGNETLVAGDIYMKYSEASDALSITNALPSKEPDETKHFDFTIEGRNKYSKAIWYEIVLSRGLEDTSKTRLKDEFLRFRLVEIKGEERKVVLDNASYKDLREGQKIWVNTIDANTSNIEMKYELYMWIAFETKIGNTEGNDYTIDEWKNIYASIKVSVNGDFEEKKIENTFADTIKSAIKTHTTESCTPTITDDNETTDTKDDIIYFSGDNDCVNFNYVWYSGKLWRIVAINPDGSMKLITQDAITTIAWGADTTYKEENKDKDENKTSWMYQWLNEDFKDTLYNYENIIVKDADWNATADDSSTPARPKTDSTATIVKGDVGLLNAYEYYQSYKNTSKSNGYLKIGYSWWLITPYNVSNVRDVGPDGTLYNSLPSSHASVVRPSINLKSNIGIVSGGDGSLSNPYRINGDKEPGNGGELINTRLSGEYVEVDKKKYRIVGIDKDDNGNNITKLTSVDYVRDGSGVLTKYFGSNTSWATSVASGSNDYWGCYLNNTNDGTFEGTWLTEELNKYITGGTYYLGQVGDNVSYKNSICSESNTTDPTSTCTKTSSTWREGLVGLPRVGEMFSAQLGSGSSSSSVMWLITPYSSSDVRDVDSNGHLYNHSPSSHASVVRPSINLKSEIKIISGDGMSLDSAYKVGF